METQFLGQAYASRSPVLASQTAINIYPELNETTGSDVGGFYGTPGLKAVYQGSGQVRGLWATNNYLFAVVGAKVLRFDRFYGVTTLGTLPNSTGRVSITDSGSQVIIAHPDGWHWVSETGSAIAAVSGSPTSSVVAFQDNYGIFTSTGGTFGITNVGDLSTISALDIATAEGAPDDLVSLISDHREVWLFGTETTEIWSNTGAQFFPFERAPGGFIEQGCAAKWSPSKLDNSVFWLGRDRNGRGVVFRSNAYVPTRISTHAIEQAIAGYDRIDDAIGYTYQDEGHGFYVLNFPSGDKTWVYDIATKMWHQRAYRDSLGELHRHRSNCYAYFAGDHLVGDWENGKIYRMAVDLTTDAGEVIYRERAWELDTDSHKKQRIDLLELEALMGGGTSSTATGGFAYIYGLFGGATAPTTDDNVVWLQVSQDAGQTFGYERQRTLGAVGQRKARARWRRLGAGRDTVLRVATTMTRPVSWVGANATVDQYAQ